MPDPAKARCRTCNRTRRQGMIRIEGRRVGHEVGMFSVSENEAAAIQRAFHESGEWAAVVELRRHFHIQDNVNALNAVRSIVRWAGAGAVPPHPQPTSPL